MNMKIRSIFVALSLTFAVSGWSQPKKLNETQPFHQLKWREIGPYRGGRSIAVSGVYGKPKEFYMGTTGGGLWKTEDEGKEWKCVSDGFFGSGAVGAIAVSKSKPEVVYVGMGETALRGNVTYGDGIYKSEDGGATWKHMGLADTRMIGMIAVHPTNPDIVYVAALGNGFGENKDRGVYKSTDGGKSWAKILYIDEKSGAVEVHLDPANPDRIYASMWQVYRKPWTLSSGGPGSRIMRSEDAGATWTDLSEKPGLPKLPFGRIGLGISDAAPDVLWAVVEAEPGRGIYRSPDRGETWKFVSARADAIQRPFYFSRIVFDPKNANQFFVLNVSMEKSSDGGNKWTSVTARHSDHHDLWIDPADPNRMISGNDGGAAVSIDGGKTWSDQDYATAQIYHVSADNAFPYNILGAQQDNSSIRIASRTRGSGITERDWTSTAGFEPGYIVPKPNDPFVVYGGNYGGVMDRLDHRTGARRAVSPWPENVTGEGADIATMRMQWTFPIVFSPHNPNLFYVGTQYVMASDNDGESFRAISPDLTRNDKAKQAAAGGPLTKDNTGVEVYNTVFTIAESPKAKGTIWAGTDCGLVHVTLDGGKRWTNVTPKDLPANSRCSIIEASPHDAGSAYLAANNHQDGDIQPYLFKTKDYGKTWKKIVAGIDSDTVTRAIREDPVVKGLLYATTENGVWVSFDDGDHWQTLQMNLPNVPVHDLIVKDADLCIATHGRSFWVLDDISPIRQFKGMDPTKPMLFKPEVGRTISSGPVQAFVQRTGDAPTGKNPMTGMVITYWLPAKSDKVKLEMIDSSGTVVASQDTSSMGEPGLRRVSLNPRYTAHQSLRGVNMWGGSSNLLRAPMGKYSIRLTVDGTSMSQQARWEVDPNLKTDEGQMREQFELSRALGAKIDEAYSALLRIRTTKARIGRLQKGNDALAESGKAAITKLTELELALDQFNAKVSEDFLNYPVKLLNKLSTLLGSIQSGVQRPTKGMRDVYQHLDEEFSKFKKNYDEVMRTEVQKFYDKALVKAEKP
jgi:photosystem II stability/assembly factor-like uncharacterized protein